MSSCLSGGGRAYGFDLEIVKSSSPTVSSSRSSHSSSPSSTLSESSNCPLVISTKKPRTPRKRPNQTYTEAVALLAKIYPNIFSARSLGKHCKLTKARNCFVEASELLPSFPGLADAGFLLRGPPEDLPGSVIEAKAANYASKCCWSPVGCEIREPCSSPCIDDDDDFDAEPILDEEVSEGIDSIMGNLTVDSSSEDTANYADRIDPYLGYNSGTMFGLTVTSALRHTGNGDWWCSPTVEMGNIVSKPKTHTPPDKRKKKKPATTPKAEDSVSKAGDSVSAASSPRPKTSCLKPALSLNLNLDGVIKEWADGGSPFSELPDSSESPADIIAKLSDINLFSEMVGTSGIREASVLRYKEKRRSRLFSKKIRYQVRKVNADLWPRTKASVRSLPLTRASIQSPRDSDHQTETDVFIV